MVFNGTINNISAVSWLTALLMLKSVAYYRFRFIWYDGIGIVKKSVKNKLYAILLSRCGKFNNYIIYEIYVLICPN
jgi:hypothetical protein